jgi:hypothetical protein
MIDIDFINELATILLQIIHNYIFNPAELHHLNKLQRNALLSEENAKICVVSTSCLFESR